VVGLIVVIILLILVLDLLGITSIILWEDVAECGHLLVADRARSRCGVEFAGNFV